MGCEMLLSASDQGSLGNNTTIFSYNTSYDLTDQYFVFGASTEDNTTISSLQHTHEVLKHYIYHIVVPIVLAFGVFGNVLNLTVFTRRRLRDGMSEIEKAATTGLMFLAVADLLFCVAMLVGHLLKPFNVGMADSPVNTIAFYYGVYDRAIFNSLLFISTWLVVVVSIERYLAVSYPFQARQFVRVRRTVLLNVAVYVLSILFNIPHFLEFEVEASNCAEQCTCYVTFLGPYGRSVTFQKVYTMLWSVVGTFLPLGLLFMCNIQFLVEIYRSRRSFRLQAGTNHRSPQQRFTRITAILIAIICMFMILVCPSMLTVFLETRLDVSNWSDESYYRLRIAVVVFNLTQAINVSANFLLYCSLSREFRRTLNAMVCRWKQSMTSLASSPSKIRRSRSEIEDTVVVASRGRSAVDGAGCCGGSRSGSIVKKLATWRDSLSSVNKSNGVTYV